jgi:hypothetical protein
MPPLRSLYGCAGRKDDALRLLGELQEVSKRMYVNPFFFAIVHLGMGDTENARKMMQAAFEDRSTWLVGLKVAPVWDRARSDPFFQELVRKVGLP